MGPAWFPEVEMMLKQEVLHVVLPSRWERLVKRVRVRESRAIGKMMEKLKIQVVGILKAMRIEMGMVTVL